MPKKSNRFPIDPDEELKAKIVKEADAMDRSLAGQVNWNLRIYYEVKALLGSGKDNVAGEVPIVAIVQRLLKVSQEQASVLDFMTPTRLHEEKGREAPIVFQTHEVPPVEQPAKSGMSSDPQKR